MPPIEQHWCPRCQATTDHMKVKGLWKCNKCLAKKLTEARKKARALLMPDLSAKLERKIDIICPCCGAGMKISVEAIA